MKKLKVGLLVDENDQSFLNFELYKISINSDKYFIDYLIINKKNKLYNKSIVKKIFEKIKKKGLKKFIDVLAFKALEFFETFFVSRIKIFKKVFLKYKLTQFDVKKIYVEPIISSNGLFFRYDSKDLESIRSLNLDVLVRGNSGILKGEILNLCQFGIISFHHGDSDFYRGLPPGFWEVYNREPSTGFVLQRLTDELDGGDVFFKGKIGTSFLYKINQCRIYIKSIVFLHKLLEDLSINFNKKISLTKPSSNTCVYYSVPSVEQIFIYFFKTFKIGLKKIFNKIFNKTSIWSVAYKFTDEWKNNDLTQLKIIKNPYNRFLADPFNVTFENKNYIFLEDYNIKSNRGEISVYEVNSESYIEIGVALKESFHLSYPFIFKVENNFYMIPESHKVNEIRLYKCVSFPLKWEFEKTLIKEISAVDTSIFKFNNKWWLLTNKDSSNLGDYCSELHIFYADNFNSSNWLSHNINPVIFDSNFARNAGLIFSNGEFYRVFQKQSFDLYGSAMGVAKIEVLSEKEYSEKILFDVYPNFKKDIKGCHTLSFDNKVLSIDFVK